MPARQVELCKPVPAFTRMPMVFGGKEMPANTPVAIYKTTVDAQEVKVKVETAPMSQMVKDEQLRPLAHFHLADRDMQTIRDVVFNA